MSDKLQIETALNQGQGVLRLEPTWVPRAFCIPGRRLRLHPDDYYAFGANRGGIDERWLASTTRADNGPLTAPDEGLSYVHLEDGGRTSRLLLRDAVALAGEAILGREVLRRHGGWVAYSKFFDNQQPLPYHIHHSDEKAADVGQLGKPEAYYFPPQLNDHGGWFPYTFFGLNPGTTREQVRQCLADWEGRDNGILYLSRAYKLKLGTGWDVPPGILHAPGSLLTYEPQRASDVFAMFQNIVWEAYTPREMLTHNVPENRKDDLDYMVSLLDWEKNVDPDFYAHRFMPPQPAQPPEAMQAEGYRENWVVYKSEYFAAKELTVLPGRAVRVRDRGPYGAIVVQGHGTLGTLEVEAPASIRFGQMTRDEVFVSAGTAREGLLVRNPSDSDPLVLLKHFGPEA
jgi:mannose-6-phosphate isomerase class I